MLRKEMITSTTPTDDAQSSLPRQTKPVEQQTVQPRDHLNVEGYQIPLLLHVTLTPQYYHDVLLSTGHVPILQVRQTQYCLVVYGLRLWRGSKYCIDLADDRI